MSNEEKRPEEQQSDSPEVYALKQDKSGWQFSRRDFLAASGAAAAVLASAGCGKITLGSTPTPTSIPTHTASPQPSPTPTSTQTPTPRPTLEPEAMAEVCFSTNAHEEAITSLAVSQDGSLMASGSDDGNIKLWSFPEGQPLKTFDEQYKYWNVGSVAFSPDGALLAASFKDAIFRKIWSLPEGELFAAPESEEMQRTLLFSPDGSMLITADTSGLKLWSLPELEHLKSFEAATANLYLLAFSPDGALLVGGTPQYIVVWSFPDGEILNRIIDQYELVSLSIHPDSSMLASMTADGMITLWTLPDGEIIETLDAGPEGKFVLFSPDGSFLLVHTTAEPTVRLWSLAEHAYVNPLDLHERTQRSAIFSPDGTALVLGGESGAITIWSYPDLQLLGCSMDLTNTASSVTGITYETTNDAGETVTFTLPCGSALPAGAVCTCNCVSGSGCGCVGHSACSCVSHTGCSCDSYSSGGHYWYPN